MTPLAHKIVNELTLPLKRRAFVDAAGMLPKMESIHCFECTAVREASDSLARELYAEGGCPMSDVLAFLPAPKTWIECQYPDGLRIGTLLLDDGDGKNFQVWLAGAESSRLFSWQRGALVPYGTSSQYGTFQPILNPGGEGLVSGGDVTHLVPLVYGFLALINTPRIIGRRQHMPHAGLQKRLLRSGVQGKYPLHAWTEILLEVHPPVIDGEEHEAHLTGKRALHFCRAHLRIKNGRLERVRAHWRGDPALGMKQSRYRVVPGNTA